MAFAPSSFEDSRASSDMDFSDEYDDVASSHTSPTNRTFSEAARHDQYAIPSASAAHPPAPWEEGSSMIDHEFSDLDIQTLFAVVQRAQDVLPMLPPNNRRPVPALFKAYYEILPQRGIDPEDDQQIAKLIFKLGGVKTGASLEEKFAAVMARMGIELDVDTHASLSDTEGGDIQMPDLPPLGHVLGHADSSSMYPMYRGEIHEDGDTMGTESTDTGLSAIPEESQTYPSSPEVSTFVAIAPTTVPTTAPAESDDTATEQDLESTAWAFRQEHKFEFPVNTAFNHWYGRAAYASTIISQMWLARQADLEEDAEARFQEWRSVAIEAQQVPLYELPGNMFSKQAEQVAARASEIYAAKGALNRWRQRAKAASQKGSMSRKNQAELMKRIATKAHNNLMLSRAFTTWFNRAEDEVEKGQLATEAYETALKAKIFDSKKFPPSEQPQREFFTASPGPGDYGRESTPYFTPAPESTPALEPSALPAPEQAKHSVKEAKEASIAPRTKRAEEPKKEVRISQSEGRQHIDPETRRVRDEERQRAEERRSALKARTLSLVRALAQRNQRTTSSIASANGEDDHFTTPKSSPTPKHEEEMEVTIVPIQEELDERTLLARRHILRMRYFTAWEEYTKGHTTMVEYFERRKAVIPWRNRALELSNRVQVESDRRPELRGRAMRRWLKRARTHEQLTEKATWAHKKARLSQSVVGWLAASKEKKRLCRLKRQALSAWYDQPNTDATLAACADKFHAFQQTAQVVSAWRRAASQRCTSLATLSEYGARAGYYYAATGVLKAWKAVSRETSVKTSQRRDALDSWTRTKQAEAERQKMLQDYADRAAFYSGVTKIIPKWRQRAREVAESRRQQELFGQRARYYYSTKDALRTWQANAKEKRKHRLREAHLETRRLVKKGAGERAIRQWHSHLKLQTQGAVAMDETLDAVIEDRDWRHSMRTIQTWRAKAAQKAAIIASKEETAKQTVLMQWQVAAADQREFSYGAEAHWEDAACTRALKRWNLRRDQNASRPLMVAYALEKKDRRMVRSNLERWYAKTADEQIPLEASTAQSPFPQSPAKKQEEVIPGEQGRAVTQPNNRWKSSLLQGGRTEEEVYVPTPGRPSLMLGNLGIRDMVTTTPLGPVPRRSWHPDTQESSMRGSVIGGRNNRARKNLRVSFAR